MENKEKYAKTNKYQDIKSKNPKGLLKRFRLMKRNNDNQRTRHETNGHQNELENVGYCSVNRLAKTDPLSTYSNLPYRREIFSAMTFE